MLELLKLVLQQVERDILEDKEALVFSVFLVFRLALCLCTEAKGRSQSLMASPPHHSPSTSGALTSSSNGAAPSLEQVMREEEKATSVANSSPDMRTGSKQGPPSFLSLAGKDSPSLSKRVRALSSPVLVEGGGGDGDEEGEDKEYLYLHKELMKSLGSGRSFMLQRSFWNALFVSIVDTDRGHLGWNEKTTELYNR